MALGFRKDIEGINRRLDHVDKQIQSLYSSIKNLINACSLLQEQIDELILINHEKIINGKKGVGS